MEQSLKFLLISFVTTFIIAIPLIKLLYYLKINRGIFRDFTSIIARRKNKEGTPVMGGLMIVFSVIVLTYLFNWQKATTYVPIGVFGLSAMLGGIDDFLNIFGKERKLRSLQTQVRLIFVHKNFWKRFYFAVTLPYAFFKRFFYRLGSHPGKGIFAHEKIIVQVLTGSIVAWWLSYKIEWTEGFVPFLGRIEFGYFMIPVIIFIVVAMANAVNFTDGLDGLAAGSLIIAFTGYMLLAVMKNVLPIAVLSGTVVGALLAYLYFNIRPARVQMGDVGSLALGTLLAVISFALDAVWILPFVGGIFLIELLSVLAQMAYRVFFGRRLFHMAPLHHHFEILGWEESKIVERFWVIAFMLTTAGVYLEIVFSK